MSIILLISVTSLIVGGIKACPADTSNTIVHFPYNGETARSVCGPLIKDARFLCRIPEVQTTCCRDCVCPADTSKATIRIRKSDQTIVTKTCESYISSHVQASKCMSSNVNTTCCQECMKYSGGCPADTSKFKVNIQQPDGILVSKSCGSLISSLQYGYLCDNRLINLTCCQECAKHTVCPDDTLQEYISTSFGDEKLNETCAVLFNSNTKENLCEAANIKSGCCQQCANPPPDNFDASKTYNVNIYARIDESTVKKYMGPGFGYSKNKAKTVLKKEIKYLFKYMNKMYDDLKDQGLKIKLYLAGISFVDNLVQGTEINGKLVNASLLLERLSDSVAKTRKTNVQDLTILFTAFDVYDGETGSAATAGITNLGRMCHYQGVAAIVEMRGIFVSAVFGAHEIAHTLNASHDSGVCEKGYIMNAAVSRTSANIWSFSKCSVDSMKKFIGSRYYNCLMDVPKPTINYDNVPANLDILDATKLCRRRYGNDGMTGCSNNCQQIGCSYPNSNHCNPRVLSSNGMECENTKMCSNGQCVSKSNLG